MQYRELCEFGKLRPDIINLKQRNLPNLDRFDNSRNRKRWNNVKPTLIERFNDCGYEDVVLDAELEGYRVDFHMPKEDTVIAVVDDTNYLYNNKDLRSSGHFKIRYHKNLPTKPGTVHLFPIHTLLSSKKPYILNERIRKTLGLPIDVEE